MSTQNFLIASFATGYLLYVILAEHARKIYSIVVSTKFRMLLNLKIYNAWFRFTLLWWITGGIVVLATHLVFFTIAWLYVLIGLITVYPCILSVGVYVPSYQYLRYSTDTKATKKTILDSLFAATIGLVTPWILILFLIFAYTSVPFWFDYMVVLAVYLGVFFVAVYYPYYQSMEDLKRVKIGNLNAKREELVGDAEGKEILERIAIELKIERIDRDVESIKIESSHPYLILKPIAGFIVVSILAQLLVEFIKFELNLA
jgi:hypothetical protein